MLIADVSGKGTSAALYMAELKGLMLSLSQIHTSPRDLLIAANRIIAEHLDARSFITMTYAVIDLRRADDDLRARRPHAAASTCRARRRRRAGAQILAPGRHGARPEARQRRDVRAAAARRRPCRLHAGDLFVLFTDGISEAMNAARRLLRRDAARRARRGARAPAVRRAARAHPARDRGLRRRRAAARRHDDDPAANRSTDRAARPVARRSPLRRAHERPRHDLPHALRHRGERRPRPARGARRDRRSCRRDVPHSVFPLIGQRARRGPHRGASPTRPTRRGASSRATAPSCTSGAGRAAARRVRGAAAARSATASATAACSSTRMTHTSRANEDVSGGVVDNESLEFLGDAVLGFVIADLLFREFPAFDEGQKSKIKASLVSTHDAGAAGRAAGARRAPAARPRRGEDRRPPEAGAARRRLRGAHRRHLSRRRHRARARVHRARVRAAARRRARARGVVGQDYKSALQEHAAGARRAAARVPPRRHASVPITASSFRWRSSSAARRSREATRAEQEGSGAGSGAARAGEAVGIVIGCRQSLPAI